MAIVTIDDAVFTNTANAIRTKGVSGSFTPAQMPQAISNIQAGAPPLPFGLKACARFNEGANTGIALNWGFLQTTITKETLNVRWRVVVPPDYSLKVTDPNRPEIVSRPARIEYATAGVGSSFAQPAMSSYNSFPTLSSTAITFTRILEFAPAQPAGSTSDGIGAHYEGTITLTGLTPKGDIVFRFIPTISRFYMSSSFIRYYPGQIELYVY